ncbi:Tn3 family transposase [Streptomyces sp. NBC_01353]|uniref:Tn3 family transposase n=1 Tax=Streptomyces sp. NBC_01353 TaxID=2903835 RepID=UPI003DA1F4C3
MSQWRCPARRRLRAISEASAALGLVLNALVLFNTRYMDAAVNQPRADGFVVRDEDVVRLSPFVRHHINMLGRFSFQLPDLPGGLRPLRDKDATDEE